MAMKAEPQSYPEFAHQLAALLAHQERADREAIGATLKRLRFRGPEWERKKLEAAVLHSSAGRDAIQASSGITIPFGRASPISSSRRQNDRQRVPHFDVKPITRQSVPRSPSGQAHPRYLDKPHGAAEHHDYVVDGARATFPTHLDYITRTQHTEVIGDGSLGPDVLDADIDRRTWNALGVVSNISSDRTRQRNLFEAAERCERRSHAGALQVSTAHTDIWENWAASPECPTWVIDAAEMLRVARDEAWSKAGSRGKKLRHKQVDVTGAITNEQAYEYLVQADEGLGLGSAALPHFKPGRSGRVQTRFVMELPRGLSPYEQREIMERFCNVLHADGWMYVGAIHRPDPHGSEDNVHMHIDGYDRPSRWLDDHDCWDFEYKKKKPNGKFTFPYRQPKIAVARGSATQSREAAGNAYLKGLRAAFVNIANDVADGRPNTPVYVDGSYQDNGIALTPLSHLGNRIIAKEKQGLATKPGSRNAHIIYIDRLQDVRRRMVQERRALWRLTRVRLAAAESSNARAAVRASRQAEDAALISEAQAAAVVVVQEMAGSRAQCVIEHAPSPDGLEVLAAQRWLERISRISPSITDLQKQSRRAEGLRSLAQQELVSFEQLTTITRATALLLLPPNCLTGPRGFG